MTRLFIATERASQAKDLALLAQPNLNLYMRLTNCWQRQLKRLCLSNVNMHVCSYNLHVHVIATLMLVATCTATLYILHVIVTRVSITNLEYELSNDRAASQC